MSDDQPEHRHRAKESGPIALLPDEPDVADPPGVVDPPRAAEAHGAAHTHDTHVASGVPDESDAPAEPERQDQRLLPALGPQPGPILATDSFAAAGRKAMWVQVDRMLQREEAVRDPAQTDALKRYRVATRRLRAALRVFRESYPKQQVKPLRTALSELADALGAVRDLDVRLDELDRWAADRGDEAKTTVEPLRRSLDAQRQAAAATLARKLDGRSHRRLMAGLIGFVTAIYPEVAPRYGAPERTVADHAASAVWLAYEQVRAYASIVRWADLPTLHGLRIEAKRLRYAVEFLGALLGPEREWIVDRLVALQDHLGALNDATLAVAAIRSFLGERHATLAPAERAAIVSYLGERERELGRLRRGVGRVWRPVVGITFARKMARAVVRRAAT